MEKGRIVVGFDGSEGARRALRWAMEEARTRGTALHIVHTWHYPYVGDYLALADNVLRDMEQVAQHTLDAGLAEVGAVPELDATGEVLQGSAGQVLVELSADADLLVVGSRGHGGFGGLLVGSVSMQCAHHARCPVVIVPDIST